jgi:glyoxylase-like metal-dependent hydrolase (beta-lactamase superfamily II)
VTRIHHQSVGDLDIVTIVSDAPWNQNCYLIGERSSGAFLVVDPGFDSPALREAIRDIGTRPAHLLVTHGHPDHLGAASALSAALSLACRVARADERVVRHAPAYAAAFGGLRLRLPDRIAYLEPGERLLLGATDISIVAVPGHTPGSLAFDLGGVILTGDTLFRERVGRTDFPGSDPAALIASVDRLIEGVPRDALLLAGHGRPWSADPARRWWAAVGRANAIAAAAQ